MSLHRVLSMLLRLQAHGALTAEELAAESGVSVRTVYRDAARLEAAGIPLQADRGPGGGFRLMAGYQTRLTGLTGAETEAVLLICLPDAAAALGLDSASTHAARKLLAALPQAGRTAANRLLERLHVDAAEWYRSSMVPPHLPLLVRAVMDERGVRMRYASWKSVRAWHIEPLGLVVKAGAWYTVARAGDRTRIFKVAQIREVELLADRFQRPRGFSLAGYWREEVSRFEKGLLRGTATLRATPEGCRRLAELGVVAEAAVASAGPSGPDGCRMITLPVEEEEQAARMLLGLGTGIEVLAPATLRARVHELALAVAAASRARRPRA